MWRYLFSDSLRHFPGPRVVPIFGNIFQLDKKRMRLSLHRWAKIYGPVYRLRLPFGDTLVVSSYEYVRRVLIEEGDAYAGRFFGFRISEFLGLSKSVGLMQPTPTWRQLRKLSHRYMKQFGDGISRMEEILLQNAEYMVDEFHLTEGRATDVMVTIRAATVQSISLLLLGRLLTSHDQLFHLLLRYERDLIALAEVSIGGLLLDSFPWLNHLPLRASVHLRSIDKLQSECWNKIKEMQAESEVESLTQTLLDLLRNDDKRSSKAEKGASSITETHAKMVSMGLMLAGLSTTPRVMYCLLNTMAFRQDVQQKIYTEISTVLAQQGATRITVAHRSRLPYLNATILECLRAFTPAPSGAMPHTAIGDQKLSGYGTIPNGTLIMINMWTLHHDEEFWQDPDIFRPERFLDEDGQLLPPDHPNRKHLLPFGAGPRVCLGEVFAMARLFLWTAAVASKFEISLGPGSDKAWMNPNEHSEAGLLQLSSNRVVFKARE